MTADSLETALAMCKRRQLRVNNLFEYDDGEWQANLRGPDGATEFGRGETPLDALNKALVEACVAQDRQARSTLDDLLE